MLLMAQPLKHLQSESGEAGTEDAVDSGWKVRYELQWTNSHDVGSLIPAVNVWKLPRAACTSFHDRLGQGASSNDFSVNNAANTLISLGDRVISAADVNIDT